jgi:MFS family permease
LAPRRSWAPLGFLAANGLFHPDAVPPDAGFAAWGWRIPFLASSLLVGLGLWVRLRIGETAAFRAALETAPPPRVPIGELFPLSGGGVAGIAGVVACFVIFYLATTFALSFGTKTLGHSRRFSSACSWLPISRCHRHPARRLVGGPTQARGSWPPARR